jgi:chitodextrinase
VWGLPPCATLPCGAGSASDTTAPTTPTNLTLSAVSSSQINLSWNPSTDNVGVTGYKIYQNAGTTPIATVTSGTTYQNSGLTGSTTYSYTVVAYDAAGNTSPVSAAVSAKTFSATPSAACPAPAMSAWTGCYYSDQNLTTLGLVRTDPTITFNWGAGSPDPTIPADHFSVRWSGVFNFGAGSNAFTVIADDGFRLYLDGVKVMDHWVDQAPTTYTQTVTTTAGNHTVTLEYYEDGGGAVANLQWQAATSASVSDTQAPTTPTNLTASAVSSSQIRLSWSASTDNAAVAGYRIYRNGGTAPIATVSGITYQDTGLLGSTSYTYSVAAYDAAGNTSDKSATVAARTPRH